MTQYQVTAKRWEHGWTLHIRDGLTGTEVGVTQSHGLSDAAMMAREYVGLMTDQDPEHIGVVITPDVGELTKQARLARDHTRAALSAQQQAAHEVREVARALKAQGLSGRDIAAVLEVSAQRVSQLLTA